MVFTVLVAGGGDVNCELNFPSKPSVGVLREKADAAFRQRRVPGGPITKLQVHDARTGSAHDLQPGSDQLTDYCQLIAVQAQAAQAQPQLSQQPPPRPVSGSAMSMQSDLPPRGGGSQVYSRPSRPVTPSSPHTVPYNTSVTRARSPPPPSASPVDEALPFVFGEQAAERGKPHRKVDHEGKVDAVFNELDTQRMRGVRREAFVEAFNLIPSLKADAVQIFSRCDANGDGHLDIAEFRNFASLYPTLLESLYYRIRDEELNRLQADEIRKAEDTVREKTAEEQNRSRQHAEAQQKTRKLDEQLRKQMDVLSSSHAREQKAKRKHELCRVEVSEARAELQASVQQADALAQEEGTGGVRLEKLEKDIQAQNRVLAHEKEGHDAAVQRLQELQRMLEDQQRVVAMHEDRVRGAAEALQGINVRHSMETDDLSRLDDEKKGVLRHIADLDCRVAATVEAERESLSRHRDASNEVARVQAKRDMLERELNQSREKEGLCRADQREAASAVTSMSKQLHKMRGCNETLATRRKEAEQQEHGLLRQEVELRNKKDEIERFEASLRSEHRQFASRYTN